MIVNILIIRRPVIAHILVRRDDFIRAMSSRPNALFLKRSNTTRNSSIRYAGKHLLIRRSRLGFLSHYLRIIIY